MRKYLLHVCAVALSVPAMLLPVGPLSAKSVAGGPPDCNISEVNESCRLIIDRRQPVSPPGIQMYSDQTLTVIVENPYKFERYFLDYSTGAATVAPDVASSLVTGLATPLAKLAIAVTGRFGVAPAAAPADCTNLAIPNRGQLSTSVGKFSNCLSAFVREARAKVYSQLEPYAAPDSITPSPVQTRNLYSIGLDAEELVAKEAAISARISTVTSDDRFKPQPGSDGTDGKPKKDPIPVDPNDAAAIVELGDLQKAADAVGADLLGYQQRIAELLEMRCPGHPSTCPVDEKPDTANVITLVSKQDSSAIYSGMAVRTITYSLDALNIVTNSQDAVPDASKKRAIASVTIVFADQPNSSGWRSALSVFRWEASAGLFFSSLPVRSYSVAPVYSGAVVTDNRVHLDVVRPTVVPFAAANYRLTDDFGGKRWRSDLYWTFAVGVNPNTVTADFATGPSISWRAVMFSLLAHWGHETRLSQGFTNNQSLGASFSGSTVPTDSHWTTSVAFGVSVRVPALTGR